MEKLTSSAVQVSEVQDVGSAALGCGAGADNCLALVELDGGRESHGGEERGDDGGEKHVEGLVVDWLLVGWLFSGV
jgi:hypothetical protein